MDLLARIKELVMDDQIILTEKAQIEMEADGLTRRDFGMPLSMHRRSIKFCDQGIRARVLLKNYA